jgi:hypothetical protein
MGVVGMANERIPEDAKREYFPPKVVHTEKLTASATACAMADSTCVTGGSTGPIQS